MVLATWTVSKSGSPSFGPKVASSIVVWTDPGRGHDVDGMLCLGRRS